VPVQSVQAQRFHAQLLTGEPAVSPVAVAERLLAVQGQDPRAARLAIRARSAGLTAADVDRALTADRSLVITWLNRGTLHLVRSEDYWWLHALTHRPTMRSNSWRVLARAGVFDAEADKGVAVIESALTSGGPLTKFQLRDAIVAAGLPARDNVALHLLALASSRGIAVRGPMIGAQHAYVHVRDWLGSPPRPLETDVALAELARRYLAGHGPASDRDLAKWSGLPLGMARRGMTQIGSHIAERPDGLAELAGGSGDGAGLPAPRLLGGFDPVLHGWVSREPILGDHQDVVTVNGLFRPFALVDGRAAGTWAWQAGSVALEPFGPLPAAVQSALATEARDVQRFLGSQADLVEGDD
jgi:hypothetical protein